MAESIRDVHSYQVGWICAVRTEFIVACELLDEEYSTPPLPSNDDNNIYTCGRMEGLLVVIACLPRGKYGLSSAATVAQDLRHSFPSLRFGLMVGIGGGAPLENRDIRLGDVVVSIPTGRTGGVIHYEFGATMQNKSFSPVGHLNSPPRVLLTAVQQLDSIHYRRGHRIHETIAQLVQRNPRLRNDYSRPPADADILFRPSYLHQENSRPCAQCCVSAGDNTVLRPPRTSGNPIDEGSTIRIHHGLIASADRLMKDATVRDHLAETEGVMCFEMEAAGLMEGFPCLVIRGICDYSDSHKNDIWQGYAAATAAAYAKELLAILPQQDVVRGPMVSDTSQRVNRAQTSKDLQSNNPTMIETLQKQLWTTSTLQKMGFRTDQDLPASFFLAVNNVLSPANIENFLSAGKSGTSLEFPYFVAGAFLFPSTIRAINDDITLDEIVSRMTPATLRGYKRHAVKQAPFPALYPSNSPTDTVAGMAVFGLNTSQKESLHRFQNGMYDLKAAPILIETSEGVVATSAAVYVWNGPTARLIPTEQQAWNPVEMLQGEWLQGIFQNSRASEVTLEAAHSSRKMKAERKPTANPDRPERHIGDARKMRTAINDYSNDLHVAKKPISKKYVLPPKPRKGLYEDEAQQSTVGDDAYERWQLTMRKKGDIFEQSRDDDASFETPRSNVAEHKDSEESLEWEEASKDFDEVVRNRKRLN